MTYQEIRDAIAADPILQSMEASGNTQGIADALSGGRTKLASTLGGFGHVLSVLGATQGSALLDTLEALKGSISALKWAWVLLERGELDFGDAQVQTMIQQLATDGAITQEDADALLESALVADKLTHTQVGKAIAGEE